MDVRTNRFFKTIKFPPLSTVVKLGKELKYEVKSADRPGHGARYSVSSEKILCSGFIPKYTYHGGIEQFVQWAQQNTEWLQR